jgi:hypothetical protein
MDLTQQQHSVLLNLLNKSLLAAAQQNEGIAAAEAVTVIRGLIKPVEEPVTDTPEE